MNLLELLAAWLVISVPAAMLIGRWLRSVAETTPRQ